MTQGAAKVRDRVAESLQNAIDNGFEVLSWSDDVLAEDLMTCDADLEQCSRADVLAAVKDWQARRLAESGAAS